MASFNDILDPKLLACPSCGFYDNESSDTAVYCERCGTLLSNRCPNCKQRIKSKLAKYCQFCGSKLPLLKV